MAIETERFLAADEQAERGPWIVRRLRKLCSKLAFAFRASSLTRRIMTLNLAALIVLLFGMLYLDQSRAGLVEAQIDSLLTQGEVIATSIAASAITGAPPTEINAAKLIRRNDGGSVDGLPPFEFPIDPVQVAPTIQRLISPTRARARIYDFGGLLILDSRSLYARGQMQSFDYAPVEAAMPWWRRLWAEARLLQVRLWFRRGDLALYDEPAGSTVGSNGRYYPEVASALAGQPSNVLRANERGQLILSVAVPIERSRQVFGVLLLTTEPGVLEALLYSDGMFIVRLFTVAALTTVILSLLFAQQIAEPVSRLSDAAQAIRTGKAKAGESIPEFPDRRDEIGALAVSLKAMTTALYSRIDAIERFAADVSHELKNPLTSLRSAVETLPIARTDAARERLLNIIQHDVQRLDRLISDISNASRLDAELARGELEPIDVAMVMRAIVEAAKERRGRGEARLELVILNEERDSFIVRGDSSRLAQVVTNLIDNAKSFSPPNSSVRILVRVFRGYVEIGVEDDGPGVPEENLLRIFDRFYTDRPAGESFGQNSGLGLAISKQIIESHGGQIWAANRRAAEIGPDGEPIRRGARFSVRLPRLED